MESTGYKYSIGYIKPEADIIRLKQGLPLQNVSNACIASNNSKCDRANMYPITPNYPSVQGCKTKISYNKCL